MYEELLARINKLKRNGGVGYSEPGRTLCTIDVVDGDGGINKRIFLEPGTSYTVTFGGEKYTSVAAYLDDGATIIGNASLAEIGADTGEPFFCLELYEDGEWSVFCAYPGYSGKMTVSTTETIHKIDPKFLPEGSGGGFQTMEITLEMMESALETESGNVTLTENQMAILESARRSASPCIFRFSNDDVGVYMATVASLEAEDAGGVILNGYTVRNFLGCTITARYAMNFETKNGLWQFFIKQSEGDA